MLRAGTVIIIASVLIGGLNSFSFSGKPVNNINDSALASTSRVITPLLKPMGVSEDNWQATVGLITGAMAKEVVVGTLNTLYTAEHITSEPFDYENFNLLTELEGAVTEAWDSLKETFSLSALSNPIEASKGDGEMEGTSMGVMSSKFGSISAAYSYLIFVLLYIPCVSVMGAIARESSKGWMMFSIFWGLDVAYSLAAGFYQVANFSAHPTQSTVTIALIVAFNAVLIYALYRLRDRAMMRVPIKTPQSCCDNKAGHCH